MKKKLLKKNREDWKFFFFGKKYTRAKKNVLQTRVTNFYNWLKRYLYTLETVFGQRL